MSLAAEMKLLKIILVSAALATSSGAYATATSEGNGHVDIASYAAPEASGHVDVASNAAAARYLDVVASACEGNGHVDSA